MTAEDFIRGLMVNVDMVRPEWRSQLVRMAAPIIGPDSPEIAQAWETIESSWAFWNGATWAETLSN